MNTPLVRVNLTLPKDIVDEARKKGSISKFAAESMSEVLSREKRLKAMEEILAGKPTFTQIKDASKYIHNMRKREQRERDKKLGLI
jgi:hypothetical protein